MRYNRLILTLVLLLLLAACREEPEPTPPQTTAAEIAPTDEPAPTNAPPPSTASVAVLRCLKKRAAHSHLSMRVRAASARVRSVMMGCSIQGRR